MSVVYDDSPAGAWRAALEPARTCAVCLQRVCRHSDLEYQGIVPPHAVDDSAPVVLPSAGIERRIPPCRSLTA